MTSVDTLGPTEEDKIKQLVKDLYTASSTKNIDFFERHFYHKETGQHVLEPQHGDHEGIYYRINEAVFVGTAPGEIIRGSDKIFGPMNGPITNTNIVNYWNAVFNLTACKGFPGLPLDLEPGNETWIVSGIGDVAWVTNNPILKLGETYPCHFTAVLVRVRLPMSFVYAWRFVQAHLSITKPDGQLQWEPAPLPPECPEEPA